MQLATDKCQCYAYFGFSNDIGSWDKDSVIGTVDVDGVSSNDELVDIVAQLCR